MSQTISPRIPIPIKYEKLVELCRRWNISELALFGSALGNDLRPDSDVDLLVTFAPDVHIDLFDFVRIQDELRELFGRDVDLVEKDAISNPFRRHAILNNYRVIYAPGGA